MPVQPIAEFSTQRQQAEPRVWRRQELRVEGYKPGVRRAVVVLAATDGRFWAGHYGAKFASPSLRFARA